MSKEFTKDDVIKNKKSAFKTLDKLLESYINDSTGKHLKKANLISYWIKDYCRFIDFEEQFDPTRNISYKRGNIVKINFGFNIGSEYGGLHYGIVLDNKNAHNSPVLTIIPLTSIKDDKLTHNNSVNLGNEIYRSLKIKYDTIYKHIISEDEKIQTELDNFSVITEVITLLIEKCEEEFQNNKISSSETNNKLNMLIESLNQISSSKDQCIKKMQDNQKELEYLEKIGQEISGMKKGSIALINQITTISKMRIFDPRTARGVLSGISLSEEGMEKINQKVKKLYIFE